MVTHEGEEAQGEDNINIYLGPISSRPFNLTTLIEDGEGQELCIGQGLEMRASKK